VAHRVVLIPGDGTGPELTEATRRVLEATGVEFDWEVQEAGTDVMDRYGGNPLPPAVLDAVREAGVALKGPITTPVGGGFRSVNVALRKALDLFAQVRPCKTYPGVRSRYEDVDLVIGTRFADPGVVSRTPFVKRLVLRSAAALSRRSRRLGLTDAHNGLRVFNKTVADQLNLSMSGMSHADEFISLALENHWRVTEEPVEILYTEYSMSKGQPLLNGVNIIFDGWLRGRMSR